MNSFTSVIWPDSNMWHEFLSTRVMSLLLRGITLLQRHVAFAHRDSALLQRYRALWLEYRVLDMTLFKYVTRISLHVWHELMYTSDRNTLISVTWLTYTHAFIWVTWLTHTNAFIWVTWLTHTNAFTWVTWLTHTNAFIWVIWLTYASIFTQIPCHVWHELIHTSERIDISDMTHWH